jgi:hypothetical protein
MVSIRGGIDINRSGIDLRLGGGCSYVAWSRTRFPCKITFFLLQSFYWALTPLVFIANMHRSLSDGRLWAN